MYIRREPKVGAWITSKRGGRNRITAVEPGGVWTHKGFFFKHYEYKVYQPDEEIYHDEYRELLRYKGALEEIAKLGMDDTQLLSSKELHEKAVLIARKAILKEISSKLEYVSIPSIVEAVEVKLNKGKLNTVEILDFFVDEMDLVKFWETDAPFVEVSAAHIGYLIAEVGDYIVRSQDGNLCVYNPKDFTKLFREA